MLEFKALSIEDRDLFLRFLSNYEFSTYEYSFITLYLWRNYCNVEFAVFNDSLIIKKLEEKTGPYFMQPIVSSTYIVKDVIEVLINIKHNDFAMKYLLRDIEEPFLQVLKEIYGTKLSYFEDIINFDYIYEADKIINLPGDKLRKRKNQYNQFTSSYNYLIKDISEQGVIEDCLAFSKLWFEGQRYKTRQMYFELEGIRDILNYFNYLGVIGMAVYVDGKIVGFTIGEKVNTKMAIIHIEKGDTNYKGIYAFINRTFAKEYLNDMIYINREEDLGIVGLRKAKLAYDPIKLEKKYVVNFL